MRTIVVIFCDLQGSGKSTIARLLLAELERADADVKLFISDDLKPPVYEKFYKLLQENLGRHSFLIFDGTFYKKEWRDEFRRLARDNKLITIYVECPVDLALARNKKRKGKARVPSVVIHTTAKKMVAPVNPDFTIDSAQMTPEAAARKIFHEFFAIELED